MSEQYSDTPQATTFVHPEDKTHGESSTNRGKAKNCVSSVSDRLPEITVDTVGVRTNRKKAEEYGERSETDT